MSFDPCPDCTSCQNCGYVWCRAEEVSPGELGALCATCDELAARLTGWGADL